MVAIALVSLFGVLPRHFAVASLMPANASTNRTAPPARTMPLTSRLQEYFRSAVFRGYLVGNRPAILQADHDHILFRIHLSLRDRLLDVEPFRNADPDPPLLITEYDRRAEPEALPTSHDTRNTAHVQYAFLEFLLSDRPWIVSFIHNVRVSGFGSLLSPSGDTQINRLNV